MLNILTGFPDSLPPEDAEDKRWKETKHLSTGEQTYWPCDRNKLPGPVDFSVSKGTPPLRTLQGTWARRYVEEAHAFAGHLGKVFSHIPQKMNPKRKRHISNFWRPQPTRTTNQPPQNS
jgi:hypothetical protein